MSSSKDEVKVPSELRLKKEWDVAAANFLSATVTGIAIGGCASIVMFRTRSPRIGLTMFSAGVGAGYAWHKTETEFANEKASSTHA